MHGSADLWLPGEHYDREEFALERAAADLEMAAAFRRDLKQVDERLDLIWARRGSRSFGQDCRWYIVRLNDGAPPTAWMIDDGAGGYADPSQAHLDALCAKDMWRSPNGWADYKRRQARLAESQRRSRERAAEDRIDHALDLASHHLDARISVPEHPVLEKSSGG